MHNQIKARNTLGFRHDCHFYRSECIGECIEDLRTQFFFAHRTKVPLFTSGKQLAIHFNMYVKIGNPLKYVLTSEKQFYKALAIVRCSSVCEDPSNVYGYYVQKIKELHTDVYHDCKTCEAVSIRPLNLISCVWHNYSFNICQIQIHEF